MEESGDSAEDREARALLNKFLGASVLMSGMESMMASSTKEEMSTAEGSSAPGSKKVSAEPGDPIKIHLFLSEDGLGGKMDVSAPNERFAPVIRSHVRSNSGR